MKSKFKSAVSLALACLTASSLSLSSCATAKVRFQTEQQIQTVELQSTLPFTDVPVDEWYYENVQYVFDNEIMKGTAEDRFEPNLTLSRAMAVTLLYRMASEPNSNGYYNQFEDVPKSQWYTNPVKWGYDRKIVLGREIHKFVPMGDINRAEFATMLMRFSDFAKMNLPEKRCGDVSDALDVPEYASAAVSAMYKAEIIDGREGGVFDLYANITRAEAAAMIERFINNAEDAIDIFYTSDSIGKTGNTPEHLRALAEGNHRIRVHEFIYFGTTIEERHTLIPNSLTDKYHKRMLEVSDLVILCDCGAGWPWIGKNDRLHELLGQYYDWDDTYTYLPKESSVEKFMDLIGRDKDYFAFLWKEGPYKYPPSWANKYILEIPNEAYLEAKKIYDDHDLELVFMSDIVTYNLDLDSSDFIIPGDYHPNNLAGYCFALALYCTIFNEKAADQNNGALKPHMIPGGTQEEKDEYMVILKDTIQEILDAQKID